MAGKGKSKSGKGSGALDHRARVRSRRKPSPQEADTIHAYQDAIQTVLDWINATPEENGENNHLMMSLRDKVYSTAEQEAVIKRIENALYLSDLECRSHMVSWAERTDTGAHGFFLGFTDANNPDVFFEIVKERLREALHTLEDELAQVGRASRLEEKGVNGEAHSAAQIHAAAMELFRRMLEGTNTEVTPDQPGDMPSLLKVHLNNVEPELIEEAAAMLNEAVVATFPDDETMRFHEEPDFQEHTHEGGREDRYVLLNFEGAERPTDAIDTLRAYQRQIFENLRDIAHGVDSRSTGRVQ